MGYASAMIADLKNYNFEITFDLGEKERNVSQEQELGDFGNCSR